MNLTSPITIGIVDDHNLFRKGLIEIFNENPQFKVIHESGNGEEFISFLQSSPIEKLPDVFLVDLKMPKVNGIECLKFMEKKLPNHKTLVLSMFDDSPFIVKSIKFGAKGYLLKNTDTEELFNAVLQVHKNGLYINEHLSISMIKGLKIGKNKDYTSIFEPFHISQTEQEVLQYICQGLTNQDIAKKVFRSVRTIEGHRKRLISKTSVKNTAALVAWAFRKGLVE